MAVCAVGLTVVRYMLCVRSAASNAALRGRLYTIGLALGDYHEIHGCFPPPWTSLANGARGHSWRLVLMTSTRDYGDWLFSVDMREPWDAPCNRSAVRTTKYLPFFPADDVSASAPRNTQFVAVVGDETAFPPNGERTLADVVDGLENTVVVMEWPEAEIVWCEPRDLRFSKLEEDLMGSTGVRPDEALVGRSLLFADGSVYRVANPMALDTFKALLTVSGGEKVTRSELIENGTLAEY